MKKLIFIGLIIVSLLISGCSKADLLEKYSGPVNIDNADVIEVEIPAGTTSDGIAEILLENELIVNKLVFKELAKDMEADTKFKAGLYHLNQSMDAKKIIEIISQGKVYEETITITIPEGYELNRIIEVIEDSGIATEEEILDVLKNGEFSYKFLNYIDREHYFEGFLFPDTYILDSSASAYEMIDKMLNKFNLIFIEEYYAQMDLLGMNLNELISLAAIIEREAKLDAERAVVSSVFHNRLDMNMKLQSCATIQYILGERKEFLTYNDLEIESDYNTYKYSGLTPAPIASPGEKSIIAALYPEETDYLFFVTTENNDGSHYFSKTYDEHNINKNKK
ncbi:MAG: endolytic transglycosylase MltG [Bacillota bacterium]|nr:endolytic transglycosylase MltG [Bacillota bacterium]